MTEKLVEMKNTYFQWQDDDTFVISFDGGIDNDGDYYFYICEYWKDCNEWHFQKIFEDDYMEADFSDEQKRYIKNIMIDLMIS